MSIIGDLTVRLGVQMTQFTTGLRNASSQIDGFTNRTTRAFQDVNRAAGQAGNSMSVFASGAGSSFKDVSRIAQGILVSQALYGTIRAAKGAADGIAEFSSQCEEASVAFGLLMKDSSKASGFLNYLQDFAARTPYTMAQAITNARKLLAYGFPAENMNPLLTTISDAAAASGDTQSFDRIARALGQIRTKGKLAQQELLQLTEAGIPAFEILREKLHLTQEEMGKIGKLGIPAQVAINAIMKGMQERYGGAGAAMSNTMKGMLNTIKDNALIVSQIAFAPMYEAVKRVVTKIRDMSDALRSVARDTGFGGLMRSIIPDALLPKIQLLVANLRGLAQSFGRLTAALGPVISAIVEFAINTLNLALPIIQIFANAVGFLASILTSSSQGVRIFVGALMGIFVAAACVSLLLNLSRAIMSLFIVKVVAQLILGLARAIVVLSAAILTNPWIAVLGLAVGGFLALALSSKTASNALGGIGNKINTAFGNDPSKIFTPKMKENNVQADAFNKNLTLSKDKLDDMGNAAKKAGQKAKDALQSFDEVFNIKNEDENGDGLDAGAINDIGDIGSPEIPAIGIPDAEYPDPSVGIQSYFDDFVAKFKDKMRNTLIGAGLGALLGALIGGLLFGPEGAKWGAILGAGIGGIIGYFWDQLPDPAKWAIGGAGVGAAIGAIVGGLVGGPMGAVAGAALGANIGALIGLYWSGLTSPERWGSGIGGTAGAVIGAIIGGMIAGPSGAVIGGILGLGIGLIIGRFWADFTTEQKWSAGVGAGAGAAIGGIIGLIIGGPMGAAIGAVIGAGVGAIVGRYWEDLKLAFSTDTGQGTLIGTLIGGILGGPIGAVVGSILGKALVVVGKWIIDTVNQFTAWSINTTKIFVQWQNDTVKGFIAWVTETKKDLDDWIIQTLKGFSTWAIDTAKSFVDWNTNTLAGFKLWVTDSSKGFTDWVKNTSDKIIAWSRDTIKAFLDWKNGNDKAFGEWWTNTKKGFEDWKSNTAKSVETWYNDTKTKFSTWVSETFSGLGKWWGDTKTGFNSWYTETKKSIDTWYTDTFAKVKDWWTTTGEGLSKWWSETTQGFAQWGSDIYESVVKWFDKLVDKLSKAFQKMKELKDKLFKSKTDSSDDSEEEDDDDGGGSSRNYDDFRMQDSFSDWGSGNGGGMFAGMAGHAKGGIFNKEHVANFAEGNKAEAIIPLENASAMQPFVNAVSEGITASLGGILSSVKDNANAAPSGDSRPIMYVGTLIADDSGLKELDRRMRVITMQENQRRGTIG